MDIKQDITTVSKRYSATGSRTGIGGRKALGGNKAVRVGIFIPANMIALLGGPAAAQTIAKLAIIAEVGKIIHTSIPQDVELITQLHALKQ